MSFADPQLASLSAAQFKKLSDIVYQDTGIVLSEAKKSLLIARLTKRLRALDMADFASYCDYIGGAAGQSERRQLLSAITTNVTSFFREGHHFKALTHYVRDLIAADPSSRQRIRLWSAACSSGQEPYSIAISMLEAFPDIAKRDFLILASDIDPLMVAQSEAGLYSKEEVQGISSERLKRFFVEVGEGYRIKDEVKSLIRFAEMNLHSHWPFSGRFDAIFCRNVVIYFDADHRQRLWQRFADVLNPEGQLFIGHSERIDGPAMSLFNLAGATQYQRL